jgi:hypothetical protein
MLGPFAAAPAARRALVAGIATLVAMTGLVSMGDGASSAASTPLVGRLAFGDEVFWDGSYSSGRGRWAYRLQVRESRGVLRVGVDTPLIRYGAFYGIKLISPSGRERSRSDALSFEVRVRRPEVGTWKVVVTKFSDNNSVFRMRAKLDRARRIGDEPIPLFPNLRPEPPFHLRFRLPFNEGRSCWRYERRIEGATRCLRMALGPQNVGDGPLQLRFIPETDSTKPVKLRQRVERADGTHFGLPAGRVRFHPRHGHFHFAGFANLDLLRVMDDGSLVPAGQGHKVGFCMVDLAMADWGRFFQDPPGTAESNCGAGRVGKMGLSTGWIDIYGYSTTSNYVDFGSNPDGLYVVRTTVDAKNKVAETDETDNTAYAFVRVSDNSVRVLERGYGLDPFDPNKEIYEKWWMELLPRGAPVPATKPNFNLIEEARRELLRQR